MEKKNILITGPPRVGKTTLVKKILELIPEIRAKGFLSQETKEGGERVGFSLTTLDGREGVLAHINLKSGPRVARYRVNIKDIEEIAAPSISPEEGIELIVIDEIAKMECFSSAFRSEVIRALDSEIPVLATIQISRHPFLNWVRGRDDVVIYKVSPGNRDELPTSISERVKALILK
ncbi:MAG: NTPase [Acidobacteria bacterium]|nr:NTPase [Acidobacteriota bacterium]